MPAVFPEKFVFWEIHLLCKMSRKHKSRTEVILFPHVAVKDDQKSGMKLQ